eukprot:UN11294
MMSNCCIMYNRYLLGDYARYSYFFTVIGGFGLILFPREISVFLHVVAALVSFSAYILNIYYMQVPFNKTFMSVCKLMFTVHYYSLVRV